MILIADSGSTKTDWALLEGGVETRCFTTCGLNPVVLGIEKMKCLVKEELLPLLPRIEDIHQIGFFGAGCVPSQIPAVVQMFNDVFPHASCVRVDSDMLGAAIAACGDEEGVAAILGTGANSCLFDGQRIVKNTPALGYILGDEGSGAVLGRQFLNAVLKGRLPERICNSFLDETALNIPIIINKVYRESAPNRFLASISPYIRKHIDVPEVKSIVVDNFRAFFRNNIRQYNRPDLAVKCVGSMAYYYAAELKEAAVAEGFKVGKILKSPLKGLITYYGQNRY